MKVVIIGGVAGGASAAARLRRLNEQAKIIVVERGPYVSFANCGLPYYIGGEIRDRSALTLQTPQSFLTRFNIDVRVRCEAVKIDPAAKTVTLRDLESGGETLESYDKLILSPGASPVRPPIPGAELEGVFTLRNIPDTDAIRAYMESRAAKSALIVGGGYIGLEMAENLLRAGLSVTVAEMADHLIAPFDADMAADVQQYVRQKGVRLLLNSGVSAIEKQPDGRLAARVGAQKVTADLILLSVGVRPESALAAAAGLQLNERGQIVVDEAMHTSEADIYAVGDAVTVKNFYTGQETFVPLAGPANRQGRIAADNICGISSAYHGTQGTAIMRFFDLTAASVGLNEKTAAAAGIAYDKTYTYPSSHATYYPGSTNMSIKVLWEKESGRLLGAQIVGFDGVDKRMDVLSAAMRFGAGITDLTELELSYAPPFSSAKDPVNYLGFIGDNVRSGRLQQFYWHDVDALPRDGSVTLLDVRTKTEAAADAIDGFMNIPLDALRGHLDALPKDKPVYVHCFSGQRSYIACCILQGNGYTCYNLAGGIRLYRSVKREQVLQTQ
ncbi:MAG TPA: FAD-dependent oxidoreductase [Candidatus Scubalenecus merdavium]|uniref:FAD-dependent oxidoreductase n=1 Tax=Candidatus Scybalenecus merdavium TaxID=2840939 RepID=A0A9D1MVK4_9FIRM|nr:FAD-dependent oxidoreductase [Candidatus Scubalenecus merdavium]